MAAPTFLYKTLNTNRVEKVEEWLNEQSAEGWELFLVGGDSNRYLLIFRKTIVDALVEGH